MVTAAIVSAGAWKWTISQRCEVHLPKFFKWLGEEIGDSPDRRLIDSTPETDCPYRSRYIRWRCRLRARKRSDLRRFGGALQAALALHTTHRGDHGRQPFRGAGGAQSVPGARRHSLRPASLRVPPTPVQVFRRASFSSPRDVTPERLPGADSPAPPLASLAPPAPIPSHMLTCPRSLFARRIRIRA